MSVHILDHYVASRRQFLDGCCTLWLDIGFDLWLRLIGPSKLAHQRIAAVIGEIDASYVRVVKSTGSGGPVRVSATCTIKVGVAAGVRTTTTRAGEGGALERGLLRLRAKVLKKILSGFRGELVIAQSYADLAAGQVEAVELFERLFSLSWVYESGDAS